MNILELQATVSGNEFQMSTTRLVKNILHDQWLLLLVLILFSAVLAKNVSNDLFCFKWKVKP